MKKQFLTIYLFLLYCLSALVFISPPASAETQNKPSSRIYKSASELDYPPFSIVREDGIADGFSVELLKAAMKAVGLKVNITVGP